MKQGRKRPLDTPKRIIERREREGEREKERYKDRYREGGGDKRERVKEDERERETKMFLTDFKKSITHPFWFRWCAISH